MWKTQNLKEVEETVQQEREMVAKKLKPVFLYCLVKAVPQLSLGASMRLYTQH